MIWHWLQFLTYKWTDRYTDKTSKICYMDELYAEFCLQQLWYRNVWIQDRRTNRQWTKLSISNAFLGKVDNKSDIDIVTAIRWSSFTLCSKPNFKTLLVNFVLWGLFVFNNIKINYAKQSLWRCTCTSTRQNATLQQTTITEHHGPCMCGTIVIQDN